MGTAHVALPVSSAGRESRSRIWLCLAASSIAVVVAVLVLRVFTLDGLIALLAEQWSGDGRISVQNRARIGNLLVELALWAGVFGLFALTMSRSEGRAWMRSMLDDPLATSRHSVPNPATVLVLSAVSGVAIVALWVVHVRTPLRLDWLYAKEGSLEFLTFACMIGAALWSGAAARYSIRADRAPLQRWIALTYAGVALAMFLAAMEEISWGQTYFAWRTPESWAAINHQQETSLHNLLDYDALNSVTRSLSLAFAVSALLAIIVGLKFRNRYVTAVMPHLSTAPVLFFMGYSTIKFHLELPELMFGIFAACYGWRIYRAWKARSGLQREARLDATDPSPTG